MTADDTELLVAAGRRFGREAATAGLVALGKVGIANTTVAAALACGLLGADPADVTGLGSGADDAMMARKRAVVGAAVRRARNLRVLEALGCEPLLDGLYLRRHAARVDH